MNKKTILVIASLSLILFSLMIIILLFYFSFNLGGEDVAEPITTSTTEIATESNADLARLSDTVTLVNIDALPSNISDYSGFSKYYVSTDGDDSNEGSFEKPFETILHAIEVAQDYTAIFVREGSYKTANLKLTNSNFVLATYQNENVTITPESLNNDWDASEDLAISIEGNLKNVVIDGFIIKNFVEGIVYGDPNTQKNIILKNLSIKNASIGIQNTYPEHTEYLVDGLLVANVTMTDITGIGLQCGDEENNCAKNVLVQNVEVLGADGNNNDTGYDSLAMVESDNILILDSKFTNAPGDGLDFKATGVAVVNTIVENPNRNGLKFWHEGEVINTIVSKTGADAAVVFDAEETGSKFRMINSIVTQHLLDLPTSDRYAYAMTIGYDTPNSFEVELVNNIFYDLPGPIYINSESNINVENNIFYKFIHDDRFLVYGNNDLDNISDLNQKEYANENQYIDPEFTDPTSSDWTILTTSPAVDAGKKGIEVPDFDIEWDKREETSVSVGPYL